MFGLGRRREQPVDRTGGDHTPAVDRTGGDPTQAVDRTSGERAQAVDRTSGERAQAARRLRVRTRRQVTDVFAGQYVSAIRGQGLEYAESRLYVPGDDVRSLDWNATARTGLPHVKEHRSERGRTLIAAIDLSPSMRFGTTGRSKAAAAAEAVALLATAALTVGDRFGLMLHAGDESIEIAPARGEGQLHRVLDTLANHVVTETGASRRPKPKARHDSPRRTSDSRALLAALAHRDAVLCEFTDARSPAPPSATDAPPTMAPRATRGERIFVLCSDPTEIHWPEGARARIRPGDSGGALFFDGQDPAARQRFEAAAALRVARIAQSVRVRGDDFVHFRTDRDALRLWLEFFRSRECGGSART